MPKKLKVVVDTNIFISALLGSRTCRSILNALDKRFFTLIISDFLVKEIKGILTNKSLGSISPGDIERLFKVLSITAVFVNPRRTLNVCRDPEDNVILEAALAGKANLIVTGDKDLLILNPFKNITILTPKEFTLLLSKKN